MKNEGGKAKAGQECTTRPQGGRQAAMAQSAPVLRAVPHASACHGKGPVAVFDDKNETQIGIFR